MWQHKAPSTTKKLSDDLEPGVDPEVLHAWKEADGMAADSKVYWCKRHGGINYGGRDCCIKELASEGLYISTPLDQPLAENTLTIILCGKFHYW